MRRKVQPTLLANARAMIVLATPGTSSRSTCPSHSHATSTFTICCRLPTTTCSTFAMIRRLTAPMSTVGRGFSLTANVPAEEKGRAASTPSPLVQLNRRSGKLILPREHNPETVSTQASRTHSLGTYDFTTVRRDQLANVVAFDARRDGAN